MYRQPPYAPRHNQRTLPSSLGDVFFRVRHPSRNRRFRDIFLKTTGFIFPFPVPLPGTGFFYPQDIDFTTETRRSRRKILNLTTKTQRAQRKQMGKKKEKQREKGLLFLPFCFSFFVFFVPFVVSFSSFSVISVSPWLMIKGSND